MEINENKTEERGGERSGGGVRTEREETDRDERMSSVSDQESKAESKIKHPLYPYPHIPLKC